MGIEIGTRVKQGQSQVRAEQGNDTRIRSKDPGMTKRVTTNATFTAGNGRVTGANNDFLNFTVGDPIISQGGLANDGGFFQVIGLDAVNAAYLTLDPPPKNEGPVTVTIRTT